MELVFGTNQLSSINGAETYLLCLAEHLERLGHGVTVHAPDQGEMTGWARSRGIRVAVADHELPESCDGLLANDGVAALELAARYPGAPLVFVAHADHCPFCTPPQLPGVSSAVIALNDYVADHANAIAERPEVVRLCQPVDLDRFSPRGPLHATPRRALLLGNYLWGSRRELVLEALAALRIDCVQIGRHGERATPEPEGVMGDVDIVIGKGRAVVEAMAAGRATYVFDAFGSDGWVTPETWPALEADNFGGRTLDRVLGVAELRADLARYDAAMGPACRDLAIRHHAGHRHAREVVSVLERAGARAAPPAAVAAPMREMARLVRLQWQTEGRAGTLATEAQTARERADALERELLATGDRAAAAERRVAEAEARATEAVARRIEWDKGLETFARTRRYRLAQALARPLDFIRARRG